MKKEELLHQLCDLIRNVICTDTNMAAGISTLTHKLSVKPISDIPLMEQVKLCYATEGVK